jgi:hypothetical protein
MNEDLNYTTEITLQNLKTNPASVKGYAFTEWVQKAILKLTKLTF